MQTPDYSRDTEFSKLLQRRSDVDLTIAALELARDACPDISFREVHDWIEARAAELRGPVAAARDEAMALEELADCLAGRHGITGSPEAYNEADSSFLNRIIATRTGIPIGLSVLYMAVARQAGLALEGVASPGHFLTRIDSAEGPIFADPFDRGEVLALEDCYARFRTTALTRSALRKSLEPAPAKTIIIRMLNNLKTLYARQENWMAAWTVQNRLVALQPALYNERRDLAVIAVNSRRYGLAVGLLENCLTTCPETEREELGKYLDTAKRLAVTLN